MVCPPLCSHGLLLEHKHHKDPLAEGTCPILLGVAARPDVERQHVVIVKESAGVTGATAVATAVVAVPRLRSQSHPGKFVSTRRAHTGWRCVLSHLKK